MNNLFFLLEKEFKQIFRDPAILRLILLMPIIQLIVIPLAADYEVKQINISVVDQDHSPYSRRLTDKLTASDYFQLVEYHNSYQKSLETSGRGETDIILTIPPNFERDLIKENKNTLHLAADAVNGIRASLGVAYAGQMINSFNQEIREEWVQFPRMFPLPQIEITSSNWYNPHINYYLFMVPGILVILVTMVGSFIAALNIVAEKEVGTIEQLNVTPLKKHEFILGKLIPFWVLGMVSITLGMLLAWLIFGIIPVGSYLTVYVFGAVYLLGVLGVGLWVSTFVDTQQQATLFAFFLMMIFILLGGLYTPIESMPEWAQWLTKINPPAYFIRVIRAVFIKGSTFMELLPDFFAMVGFAVVFNFLAVRNYSKRTT
ncbi:ABC transporter permease [Arcticibacterium luteifluviistationis]|uniref:ABC transporter permease n=1 Tax=Arcticibacterium luteifluviistationis TaxID=1784714 RepID=A0A2Z4GDW6_9BACT|nr:ABC transporter permease [Arcticibacterium luteifluviistationis]AWV99340.1 ABC transporter permease [Arcticibacterium luteifluviistationis]